MIARGTAGGREPVGLFFAIDLVVNLLLNGTSLVTRDGAEDAHVRTPLSVYRCCTAVAVVQRHVRADGERSSPFSSFYPFRAASSGFRVG